MSTYLYKARDATGKPVKGTMEAADKQELIDKLHKMGYMTTNVSEVATGIQIGSIFDKLKWISSEDMLMFYIQLSNMINAGITILMSLSGLAKQIENRTLKETVGSVARQQEELKQKIICAGAAVSLFIVTFIIPQFAQIYLKAG